MDTESRKRVQTRLFAGRNRDADAENGHVTQHGKERVRQMGRAGLTCMHYSV